MADSNTWIESSLTQLCSLSSVVCDSWLPDSMNRFFSQISFTQLSPYQNFTKGMSWLELLKAELIGKFHRLRQDSSPNKKDSKAILSLSLSQIKHRMLTAMRQWQIYWTKLSSWRTSILPLEKGERNGPFNPMLGTLPPQHNFLQLRLLWGCPLRINWEPVQHSDIFCDKTQIEIEENMRCNKCIVVLQGGINLGPPTSGRTALLSYVNFCNCAFLSGVRCG